MSIYIFSNREKYLIAQKWDLKLLVIIIINSIDIIKNIVVEDI